MYNSREYPISSIFRARKTGCMSKNYIPLLFFCVYILLYPRAPPEIYSTARDYPVTERVPMRATWRHAMSFTRAETNRSRVTTLGVSTKCRTRKKIVPAFGYCGRFHILCRQRDGQRRESIGGDYLVLLANRGKGRFDGTRISILLAAYAHDTLS